MLVLAMDTSTEALSVAVRDLTEPDPGDSRRETVALGPVLAERTELAPHRHTERLSPLITETLAEAGVSGSALDAVAVGLGPGPFTGLRVGIVTAAAMADAYGTPVYGHSSLDILAASVCPTQDSVARDLELVVVVPARRDQVYWARYSPTETLLEGPAIDRPADLAGRLDRARVWLAGVGARHTYRDIFGAFELAETDYPRARELSREVVSKCWRRAPSDDLAPTYLRPPDAVPPAAVAAAAR